MNGSHLRQLKRRLYWLPLLLAVVWLRQSVPLQAQQTDTEDEPYWRYSAARRITHVLPADINQDGTSDFLIAAENGRVELLNAANAQVLWSFIANDAIQAIQAIQAHPQTPGLEISLVSDNQLILLDSQGQELWRTQLTAVDPPPVSNTTDPESLQDWYKQFDLTVRQILPFVMGPDGRQEILLLLDDGQLLLYDGQSNLLRRYNQFALFGEEVTPHVVVGDLNQDGQQEIVMGMFNPDKKFSELFLLDADGNLMWEDSPPISGHITAMTLVPFGPDGHLDIAVGTDWGNLHLYGYDRQRRWYPRTLNKPISTLTTAQFPEGPALIAGTDVGMVVAYSAEGRRFWTRRLTNDADRPVIGLTAVSYIPEPRNPVLAAVLGPDVQTGGNQQVRLLDTGGLEIAAYEAGEDNVSLTQLLDINGDQRSELILTRFANVEMQGLGSGVSETAREWAYSLDAAPGALLVVDFDQDGRDELLLGAQNGKLHYLVNGNDLEWLHAPGGAITQLAVLERTNFPEPIPTIVVGRNRTDAMPDTLLPFESWVELRHINGERIWEVGLNAPISAMLVENTNRVGEPEIIIGTEDGSIVLITATGIITWRTTIRNNNQETEPIQQLLLVDGPGGDPRIIAATGSHLYSTRPGSPNLPISVTVFDSGPLQQLFPLNQPGGDLAGRVLALADDARGLNWRGIQLPPWPLHLDGSPITAVEAPDPIQEPFETETTESFLIATDNDKLVRLSIQNNQPKLQWVLGGMENTTSLYWGDLDGNRLPEFAVGDDDGKIRLFTSVPQAKYLDELPLTSGIFAMTALRRGVENRADLLVVTENGEVQLFSAQENHPPLLTNPATDVAPGQYGFNVSVFDADGDTVRVRLDIQDPETGEWIPYRESEVASGTGPVFWNINQPPATAVGVSYRYYYNDNSHSGFIYPPAGPLPIVPEQIENNLWVPLLTGVIGVVVLWVMVRQVQSPAMRTRRFYWRLKRWPTETLMRLENRFISTAGSPDFLLALSGLARQQEDDLVSKLAEGLYLQTDRPAMGLPIILTALETANQKQPRWQEIDRWLLLFKTGQELLTAPTLTALSLEWTQLNDLLQWLEKNDYWSPAYHMLQPVLTTIRDSERVDRPDDRLVYLREATAQLTAVRQDLPEYDTAIEKPLVLALAHRWTGLVSAEAEELRGRAELIISLKTRRIIPNEPTQVTFEIKNDGRAPAENLIVVLNDDPAYAATGWPETISLLPPGNTCQVFFDVRPLVGDRFRISLTATFNDRNQNDKMVAFGDQIDVLTLARDFSPIPNPYRPGTPLRQNSTVFYGREWFFNFITENAGNWSQRNVLILIGQRRTGKTSALLNLEQHLPPPLLPVYIDCQSLGVVPGMAALFHDWAWLIADALALRDIEIDVPKMAVWEDDPTGAFQRRFLPTVRALLPQDTTLLLVFDEFEVFEHLVQDGLLPPTFFNFLRHLMQHSQGLSFVFVGTRRLEEMGADYWSVLFNIALYQHITYLRDESAVKLITEPVAPYLVYDDLALDKILRVTAGHPYFLQLVCYTLVKRANHHRKGYVTISDVNAALDEMLSLGEVHFAYIWQRSSYTEQAILTAVSHLQDRQQPFHPEEFIHFLERYDIHLDPIEVTRALNTLVEREIMREVHAGATTYYELRLGLVGLWTAQHKSLSKLHAMPVNGNPQNGKAKSTLPAGD